MFKKFVVVLAVLLGVGIIAAPAPSASAKVPVVADQIVGYDDHQGEPIRSYHQASDEIYRSDVAGSCLIERRFYPSALVARQLSAVLLWVPSGNTYCNWLGVRQLNGTEWGTCVGKLNWGYNFGPGFNDNVWTIIVRKSASCPAWANN